MTQAVLRIAILAITGLAVVSGSASATEAGDYGPGRPFGEAELAAIAQAEAFWGRQPELCTSRKAEVVAPGQLGTREEDGGEVAGRATRPFAPRPCGMWIEEDDLSRGLCTIVRHEYGHWLGFGHEDPELAQMPACEETQPSPYGEAEPGYEIYPVDQKAEAWNRWQMHRRECTKLRAVRRQECLEVSRRYAEKLRRRYSRRKSAER